MYNEDKLWRIPMLTSREVIESPQGRAFFAALNRKGEWRNTLYDMPFGKAPHFIRCDKPHEISKPHTINGRYYDKWENVIMGKNNGKKRKSLYMTLNATTGTGHNEGDVQACRALWVDVDCHDEAVSYRTVHWMINELMHRFDRDGVPLPFVCHSGRGIHLIWFIVPVERGAHSYGIRRWKQVEHEMVSYVESITDDCPCASAMSVDRKACDPARLIRVPGSWNFSSRTFDTVLYAGDAEFNISVLEEFFGLDPVPEKEPKHVAPYNCPGRKSDLYRWAENRGWDFEGYRNTFLTIIASLLVQEGNSAKQVTEILLNLNSRFVSSLPVSAVKATARSCYKNKYKWSNEEIANRLDMSQQERGFLKKMTPGRAYYLAKATGKDTRVKNRRRDAERAARKVAKNQQYDKLAILRFEGKNASEIAVELHVSIRFVYSHWNRPLPGWYIDRLRKPTDEQDKKPICLKRRKWDARRRRQVALAKKKKAAVKTVVEKSTDGLFAAPKTSAQKKSGGLFAAPKGKTSFVSDTTKIGGTINIVQPVGPEGRGGGGPDTANVDPSVGSRGP